MTKFTDELWRDVVREHGRTLMEADHMQSRTSRMLRRPRVIAGSTLGVAAAAATAVLAFGGTTATAPAYAVTQGAGGVQVRLNYTTGQNLPQVNDKLAAMGTGEAIQIQMAPGAATTGGSVTCTPAAGVSGPAVSVLVGQNGTEVIQPGQSAGNTAEGSFHLASCTAVTAGTQGNTGAA